ncbi:DUF3168 domain-containing protein [Pacificimonas sp. ICDLI1SI03]
MRGSHELQVAVRAALLGAPGLNGWPVWDGPPAEGAAPYLVIGPELIVEAGAKEVALRRHRFAISCWAVGGGVAPLKPRMLAVEQALLNIPAELPTVRIVEMRFLRAFTVRETREGLVHGEVEFEALLQG